MSGEPICCLDIEASSLLPGSFPVEIGWCSAGAGRNWSSHLIAPDSSWTMNFWSYESQNVHGIDRQETIDHGILPLEMANLLNEKFVGQSLLVDALSYDNYWMQCLYAAAGIDPTFTLVDIEMYLWRFMEAFEANAEKRMEWLDLAMTASRDAIPHNHRAGQDAAGNAYIVELIQRTQSEEHLRSFLRQDANHRRLCMIAAGVPDEVAGGLR